MAHASKLSFPDQKQSNPIRMLKQCNAHVPKQEELTEVVLQAIRAALLFENHRVRLKIS
jgi:hypothetical protein